MSDNSSGFGEIVRCQNERASTRWVDNDTGADLSNFKVTLCNTFGVDKGFEVVGSNALGPWVFELCSAVDCNIAFDIGHDASSSTFRDCGATRCGRFVKSAGGKPPNIYGGRTEDCDWAFEFGGNNTDGEGQTAVINVFGGMHDGLKSGLAKVRKAGQVNFYGVEVPR